MEVSNDEAEPWLAVLDVDKTLCIDSTELDRLCNESDDCHCCCDAYADEVLSEADGRNIC